MLDLLKSLTQIQTSAAVPLWLRLSIALGLVIPVLVLILGPLTLLGVARMRRARARFARKMGWKWEGGGAFSGRLANGAGWEGGAYADERTGPYLKWSGGPLACRTENRMYVVSRAEYERQLAAHQNSSLSPRGELRAAPVALMSRSVDGSDAANLVVAAAEPPRLPMPFKGEAAWAVDPSIQPCPVNNRAFDERFVLLSNNRAFALTAFSDSAVSQLLDWDAALPERLKIRLAWNLLTLELRPGPTDALDIEKLGQLALTIAENANASNGAAYWSYLKSARLPRQ